MKGLLLILMLIACFTGITKLGLYTWTSIEQADPFPQALRRLVQERIEQASRQEMEGWCFRGEPLVLEVSKSRQGPVYSSSESMQAKIQLKVQQFDPGAVVAILPGLDGKPGVAGVDDNGNGQTDERIELGATQSDDRCLAMNGDVARAMNPRPLILQRGAFVPVVSPTDLVPDAEQRLEVKVEQQLDKPGAGFSLLITDRKPLFRD